MSKTDNSIVVDKTKKILKEMGYEVKTSHLFELYSKLSGEQNWHVASSKGTSFKSFINTLFMGKKVEIDLTKAYLDMVQDKDLQDYFFLGFHEATNKPILRKFTESPNAIFIGAIGSGKSISCKMTIAAWMAQNAHRTQLFIVDTLKGAGDYSSFFKTENGKSLFPQVCPVLDSAEKAKKVIELLWEEYEARQKLFRSVDVSSINNFEKKTGRVINRIVMISEEFNNLMTVINFKEDYKTSNTAANKFWMLMKVGRSAGIWFLSCSGKGTTADIPTEIIQNFMNKQVFKVSSSESAYLTGSTEASEIKDSERGRCFTENGFAQFAYLKNDQLDNIIAKSATPLIGEFACLSLKLIDEVITQASLNPYFKQLKMTDLIKDVENKPHNTIITILHEKSGDKVEELNKDHYTKMSLTHLVTIKDKLKVGVMTMMSKDSQLTIEAIHGMIDGMMTTGCKRGIIYTLDDMSNRTIEKFNRLYEFAENNKIEIITYDDLLKIAEKIDQSR